MILIAILCSPHEPRSRHNQPPPAGRINIQNMFTASPQGVHNVIFFSNLFGNITAGIYSRAHYRRGIQSRDKIPDAGIALVAHSLESSWDLSHHFYPTYSCKAVWEVCSLLKGLVRLVVGLWFDIAVIGGVEDTPVWSRCRKIVFPVRFAVSSCLRRYVFRACPICACVSE